MITESMLLYFVPPSFASGKPNSERRKRLMLVIKKDDVNKTLTLINISKVSNKPNCLTYTSNCLIRKYNPPLPLLSFAKLNDNYILEDFSELDKYVYKQGEKLNKKEFVNIQTKYREYKSNNNKIELLFITKEEFLSFN